MKSKHNGFVLAAGCMSALATIIAVPLLANLFFHRTLLRFLGIDLYLWIFRLSYQWYLLAAILALVLAELARSRTPATASPHVTRITTVSIFLSIAVIVLYLFLTFTGHVIA